MTYRRLTRFICKRHTREYIRWSTGDRHFRHQVRNDSPPHSGMSRESSEKVHGHSHRRLSPRRQGGTSRHDNVGREKERGRERRMGEGGRSVGARKVITKTRSEVCRKDISWTSVKVSWYELGRRSAFAHGVIEWPSTRTLGTSTSERYLWQGRAQELPARTRRERDDIYAGRGSERIALRRWINSQPLAVWTRAPKKETGNSLFTRTFVRTNERADSLETWDTSLHLVYTEEML